MSDKLDDWGMELLELIGSIIPWVIWVAFALVMGAALLVFLFLSLPWWGFTQFEEETILKNQLKRLQKATGMTLPPYDVTFNGPITDLNGSFYGLIQLRFKELLTEEYWKELEKRIKDADPCFLWVDKKLHTSFILELNKDKHTMCLKYGRIYLGEEKHHGTFRIYDNRNALESIVKSMKISLKMVLEVSEA